MSGADAMENPNAGRGSSRAAWMVRLALLKLREGPGPFCRSMTRGAFQLLPPATQSFVLRATGARRRRRRHGLLPPPPSGPPESPGLVSVVLPVYEQSEWLDGAIRSVLIQTWRELELIVLDDGSGPEVADVVRRHVGDPRVRWLRQSNRGLPAALNAAFELATGEFRCWTSADNLMRPRQLESLVRFLRERADVSMVYADYDLIDDADHPVHGTEFRVAFRRGPADPHVRLPRDPLALAIVQDNFVGPCFCYRASVGRLLGDYDSRTGLEDYDYWLRLDRSFRLAHLGREGSLYRYRLHEKSLTARGQELDLQRRAGELLDEERGRSEWQAEPVRFVVSDDIADRVEALLAPGESIARAGDGDGREIAVASAVSAVAPDASSLLDGRVVALWFDAPEHAYEAADLLARDDVVACTASTEVASRLAIFTPRVFVDAAGGRWLAWVRVFAADRSLARRNGHHAAAKSLPPWPVRDRPSRILVLAPAAEGASLSEIAQCLRPHGGELVVAATAPDGDRDAVVEWLDERGAGPKLGDASAYVGSVTALARAEREGTVPPERMIVLPGADVAERCGRALLWLAQGGSITGARALAGR